MAEITREQADAFGLLLNRVPFGLMGVPISIIAVSDSGAVGSACQGQNFTVTVLLDEAAKITGTGDGILIAFVDLNTGASINTPIFLPLYTGVPQVSQSFSSNGLPTSFSIIATRWFSNPPHFHPQYALFPMRIYACEEEREAGEETPEGLMGVPISIIVSQGTLNIDSVAVDIPLTMFIQEK